MRCYLHSGDDLRDFRADGLAHVKAFQVNAERDLVPVADFQYLEALPVVCPVDHVLIVADFQAHAAADAQPFSRDNAIPV